MFNHDDASYLHTSLYDQSLNILTLKFSFPVIAPDPKRKKEKNEIIHPPKGKKLADI
jgi:hypothetical protein